MAEKKSIRAGMQVLGSDGGMVGRVSGLHGDHIHVEPDAPTSSGDRLIPNKWVARIDDHVHLDRNAALVRETWGTEEKIAAAGPVRREAAHSGMGKSWIVWAIGALLLLLVIALGIWGFDYATDDPEYGDRTELIERGDTAAAPAQPPGGALGTEIERYLTSNEAVPRSFALENLRFAEGSAEIRSESREDLAALGRTIAARPDSRVRITGYGDGGEGSSLGENRAEAVAAALIANGVRPANIETTAGEGGGKPAELTILSR